ncbi:MAG: hypothetical protein WA655_14430 [Candidatus Korobacteraceae bacterium]
MLWHPFLLLVRKRLIAIAILALGVPVAVVLSGDVRSLVVISEAINLFLCILIGASLGWTSAKTRAAETRFLFTRPIPRLAVLLRPLIVASFAIAVFPLATFVLLLGWLCLLPTARSRLVTMVETLPSASSLGLHPSPLHVLATMHFASCYLVAVSGGLIFYAAIASRRWLALSPKWLRSLIGFSALFFLLPVVFWGLRPPGRAGFGAIANALAYLPSALLIVWPLAFAAMVLYCCWRIIQGIDELPGSDHSSVGMRVEETIRALRAARAAK